MAGGLRGLHHRPSRSRDHLPGRAGRAVRARQGRADRVVGDVAAPAAGVTAAEVAGRRSYDFELIGETFRGDDLLESFRYRFDVAAEADGPDPVPLSFRRDLRPGLTYRFVVRIQDLHSNRYCRLEKEVTVPEASAVESAEAGGEGALPADTAGEAPTDAATPRRRACACGRRPTWW